MASKVRTGPMEGQCGRSSAPQGVRAKRGVKLLSRLGIHGLSAWSWSSGSGPRAPGADAAQREKDNRPVSVRLTGYEIGLGR